MCLSNYDFVVGLPAATVIESYTEIIIARKDDYTLVYTNQIYRSYYLSLRSCDSNRQSVLSEILLKLLPNS